MARWMDNAAGGISQRLHPGGATIRSRCRNPAAMGNPFASSRSQVGVTLGGGRAPCNRWHHGPRTSKPLIVSHNGSARRYRMPSGPAPTAT